MPSRKFNLGLLRIWELFFSVAFVGLVFVARSQNISDTNLLAQVASLQKSGGVTNALNYLAGLELSLSNCTDLCVLTKAYCDLMHDTSAADLQKTLAERALACAQRAVAADPKSATAHLCVAVGCVKNFPYGDNRTKIIWSKAIKSECETAIALDPNQDVGYYVLARWHFGVANMNWIYKGLVKIIYGGLPAASNAEAVANLKKAIGLAPQRIIHHVELAKVYEATGEKNLALAEWKIAIALKPVDRDDADALAEAEVRLTPVR